MVIEIRRAHAEDQDEIVALVHGERLNPHGLEWRNFVVAVDAGRIVGVGQVRPHGRDAGEVGSLVVVPDHRGQGLAGRLVARLVAEERRDLFVVTRREAASHYSRWGFECVRPWRAASTVARNYCLGQLFGGLNAIMTGRRINRLAVLMRPASRV